MTGMVGDYDARATNRSSGALVSVLQGGPDTEQVLMNGLPTFAQQQAHGDTVEPLGQLLIGQRLLQASFQALPGSLPPGRATGLIELVGVLVAAIEQFPEKLALLFWQRQGHELVAHTLSAGRAWQATIDQASVVECFAAERGAAVLGQPGLDLRAEKHLAAPIVVDQVRALTDVAGAIGG